jgi:hypothetical protein
VKVTGDLAKHFVPETVSYSRRTMSTPKVGRCVGEFARTSRSRLPCISTGNATMAYNQRTVFESRNLYTQYARRGSLVRGIANIGKPSNVSSNTTSAFFKNKDNERNKRPLSERMSLVGKTTVITGGARGIGLSLVEAVAEAGGDVAVLDVLEQPQTDLSTLGIKAKYYR